MKKPLIMGIVNITPDSFSDGGHFLDSDKAIAHGLKLIRDGADMLDIGGESTRPGAKPISLEEEIRRIMPVIKELSKTGKFISVDTRHTDVMAAALAAGAGFINDISALKDKGAIGLAACANVPVCLMHMQGQPGNMQDNPTYKNVVEDVFDFLKSRIDACTDSGIGKDKIYIDVGIGFGKTLQHNIELLQNLQKFRELGVKMLMATSRKKFIENISGQAAPSERIGGSLAATLRGFEKNVDILRVHDVFETRQALDVWTALA